MSLSLQRRHVEFVVYGDPASQAGMRTVPIRRGDGSFVMKNGRVVTRQISEGSKGLKSWRQEVSDAAKLAAEQHGMFDGPVEAWIEWRFPMPRSRPKWARLLGVVLRTVKPDGDKLQRAVWDSLKTGGLIKDDAVIARWHGTKVEVSSGPVGAIVRLAEIPSGQP